MSKTKPYFLKKNKAPAGMSKTKPVLYLPNVLYITVTALITPRINCITASIAAQYRFSINCFVN